MEELTQGNYIDASALYINPEHIPDIYDEKNAYSARFDRNKPEDKK